MCDFVGVPTGSQVEINCVAANRCCGTFDEVHRWGVYKGHVNYDGIMADHVVYNESYACPGCGGQIVELYRLCSEPSFYFVLEKSKVDNQVVNL